MPKLALFDLDDTLVDRIAAYRRWVDVFASTRELSADDLSVLHDVDLMQVLLPEQLERIRQHFEVPQSSQDFWDMFTEVFPRFIRSEPQTLKGLIRLRENGWTVGIVTNGDTDLQTEKITMAGLDRCVDGWVISQTHGVAKPDTQLFEAAADQLAVPLSAGGWMVGDNLDTDIAGGNAAGLATIWLHHGRTRESVAAQPVHSVETISEAVELILAS